LKNAKSEIDIARIQSEIAVMAAEISAARKFLKRSKPSVYLLHKATLGWLCCWWNLYYRILGVSESSFGLCLAGCQWKVRL